MPQPYQAYLARKGATLRTKVRPLGDTPHEGLPAPLAQRVAARVDALEPALVGLSHDLHAHPEVAFAETRSAARIAQLLGEHGVQVQVGAFGLPTALHAAAGAATAGGPRVGIVAEYDALPEVGHGCGHNIIAATAVGAFLAVREIIGATGGSVELIGTPAEESGGGKELILEAGGFDGLSAVIMVHPSGLDVASWSSYSGRRQVQAVYTGQGAHAAANPFLGRNALDAAVLGYQGIAMLRQHMLPTDRLHMIIPEGGTAVNVVPDRAVLLGNVRSLDLDTLATLSEKVEEVLRGAAQTTGTEVEVSWDPTPPYLPLRSNLALAGRYVRAMAGRREVWWHCESGDASGSTDLGNVSAWVPAIHPTIAITDGPVPGHSAQMAAQAITARADAAIADGAYALAIVAGDVLTDAGLRADITAEFEAAGGPQRAADVLGQR